MPPSSAPTPEDLRAAIQTGDAAALREILPNLPFSPALARMMYGFRDLLHSRGMPISPGLLSLLASVGSAHNDNLAGLQSLYPTLRDAYLRTLAPADAELPAPEHAAHVDALSVASTRPHDPGPVLPSGFPRGTVQFLLTILDRPLDHGAYLMFADWLEEQGDADHAGNLRAFVKLTLSTLPDQYASEVAGLRSLRGADGQPLLTDHNGRLSFLGEHRRRYTLPTLQEIAAGLVTVTDLDTVLRSTAQGLRTFSIAALLPVRDLEDDLRRRIENLRDTPHPGSGAHSTSLCATDLQGNLHPLRRDQVSDDDPLWLLSNWHGAAVRFGPTLTDGVLAGGQTFADFQAANAGFRVAFQDGLPFQPHQDEDLTAPLFAGQRQLLPGGLRGTDYARRLRTDPRYGGQSPWGIHDYLSACRASLAVAGRLLDCRIDPRTEELQWAARWLLDTIDTSSGFAGYARWNRRFRQAFIGGLRPVNRVSSTACPRSLRVKPLILGA